MEEDVRKNLADVRRRIKNAAARAGRKAEEIKLVAVSKTHPPRVLREAIAKGLFIFGENKVQEAEGKIVEIGRENAEWHLIGHLQSNKARKAVRLFDVIQSLDSLELAGRLERICLEEGRKELPVFVQIDLAGEVSRSGIEEKNLAQLIDFTAGCKCLKLEGLMILPPYFDEAEKSRPYFQKLRGIRDKFLPHGGLSMGMTNDFEIAIEQGATVVRIGTALFGERSKI